ncbi:MAG: cytochrome c biogenesis protein [Deltaproteobacteria bacterium]|nr:cytochrome c biogenesis protein [Deltaproteobacteria bacterium]
MNRALTIALAAACMALLAYTQYLIFFVAPMDRLLLFNQKIFYYHVPSSFMLFAAVFTCGIASLLYLKRRTGKYDDVAVAGGELAVVFGAIVLVTGSIWGRAAWGIWWSWDARLTSSLLLWMSMLAYVLVRKYGGHGSERLSAGLAVFAMVNVPLVYFSVRIWRTLHPKATVVPTLSGQMRLALWLSVLAFTILFILLVRVRARTARVERNLHELHERGLDAGILE